MHVRGTVIFWDVAGRMTGEQRVAWVLPRPKHPERDSGAAFGTLKISGRLERPVSSSSRHRSFSLCSLAAGLSCLMCLQAAMSVVRSLSKGHRPAGSGVCNAEIDGYTHLVIPDQSRRTLKVRADSRAEIGLRTSGKVIDVFRFACRDNFIAGLILFVFLLFSRRRGYVQPSFVSSSPEKFPLMGVPSDGRKCCRFSTSSGDFQRSLLQVSSRQSLPFHACA